jgi:hypothetical protein
MTRSIRYRGTMSCVENSIAPDSAPANEQDESEAVLREWSSEIERRVRAARSDPAALLDGPAALDDIFA